MEAHGHLFLHCPIAWTLWTHLFDRFGVYWFFLWILSVLYLIHIKVLVGERMIYCCAEGLYLLGYGCCDWIEMLGTLGLLLTLWSYGTRWLFWCLFRLKQMDSLRTFLYLTCRVINQLPFIEFHLFFSFFIFVLFGFGCKSTSTPLV